MAWYCQASLDEVTAQLEALHKKNDEGAREIQGLREEVRALTERKRTARGRMAELEREAEAKDGEIEELIEAVEYLTSQAF